MSPIWLVVHPDADLCESLRAHGASAELVSSPSVSAGINACCALEPACIVASAKLAEKDVRRLVFAIRGQPAIAAVPIVVLSAGDEPCRIGLLKQGADQVLHAPIGPALVVAAVEALLTMSNRPREGARSSRRGPRSSVRTPRANIDLDPAAPLSGLIEASTIATLLAVLAAKQASGRLSIGRTQAARQRIALHISNGQVMFGRAPGEELSAADAVDAALRWVSGHFEFTPGDDASEPGGKRTVPAPPMTTVDPPVTAVDALPALRRPTLRAGFSALKPPSQPTPLPTAAAQSGRSETLVSHPSAGGPTERSVPGRISPIPVEAPKQPWQPPKKSTASQKSASRTMTTVEAEPSTRRPR